MARKPGRSVCAGWAALALLALTATGVAAHPPTSTVPPTLEIVVLDPNVDPLGNPAVQLRPMGGMGLQVDVPPMVLVHRYYYTGDRSFQGPLLAGGPSVVVANHPKTGERLYIPVQMLPGAPRVSYSSNSITYDYGQQGITIHFCCLSGKARVDYRNGVAVTKQVCDAAGQVGQCARNLIERTGISNACQKIGEFSKNVAETTADHLGGIGRAVVTPPLQAAKLLPGVNLLTSPPEERAQRERDLQVRRATEEASRLQGTIPTLR